MDTTEIKKEMLELISGKFDESKEIEPTIFALADEQMMIMPVGNLMGNKDIISIMLDKLRIASPFVCFTSEAWMVVRDQKEGLGNKLPEECDDRQEKLMVYFYEPLAIEFWTASINRDGKEVTLGEFERHQMQSMKGRFAHQHPTAPSEN